MSYLKFEQFLFIKDAFSIENYTIAEVNFFVVVILALVRCKSVPVKNCSSKQ